MTSSKTPYVIGVWHPHHPFNANISVINQNPLHHQDITTWHSDDVIVCFGMKAYTCTWLTKWKNLLWAGMQRQTLWSLPFYKGRNGSPRCTLWHSPRSLNVPSHWASQDTFIPKIWKNIYNVIFTGMFMVTNWSMHKITIFTWLV